MILTEVGEIGVHVGGEDFILRPSLYAISRLGTPRQIVEIYACVMGEPSGDLWRREQFEWALAVINQCSDRDVSEIFGYIGEDLRYNRGAAPVEHILPLARCLLKHGVVGALPPLPNSHRDEDDYVQEFDARSHVAAAMAHLGVSERDAWGMTMTSLVAALRAKFPPVVSNAPGARAPTKEQHEATEAWFEKIDARRKKAASRPE